MELNKKQKIVLWIITVTIIVMFLFPPFNMTDGTTYAFDGYYFLFHRDIISRIDAHTLFIQLIGTLIIGGLAFLLVSGKEKKGE
ncbi:MAG TPA: hypothetical protein PLO29_06995 [Paludibacter sp.]|nr:hypothetical protein [Paludibacter sp.]